MIFWEVDSRFNLHLSIHLANPFKLLELFGIVTEPQSVSLLSQARLSLMQIQVLNAASEKAEQRRNSATWTGIPLYTWSALFVRLWINSWMNAQKHFPTCSYLLYSECTLINLEKWKYWRARGSKLNIFFFPSSGNASRRSIFIAADKLHLCFFLPEYNSWTVKHSVTFHCFALMFFCELKYCNR